MATFTNTENENQLLIGFWNGDAFARNEFVIKIMPRIRVESRRIARDLPLDIQEEIAQQTFLNLLIMPSQKFDPVRGTAWQFLIGQIWNAEKQVRRSYNYPQRRTHKENLEVPSHNKSKSFPKFVSFEAERYDLPPDEIENTFESCHFVQTVIRKVRPPATAAALRMMCFQDKTKNETAAALGLSRFQLQRKLTALRHEIYHYSRN